MTERITNVWAIFLTACIVPFVQFFYGTHSIVVPLFTVFTILIVLDWLAGWTVAKRTNTYASTYGVSGAIRTVFLYVALSLGHQVDVLFGLDTPITLGLVFATIAIPTAESVIANMVIIGWDRHVKTEWISGILSVASKLVESEIEYKKARIVKRKEDKQ